MTTFLFAPAAFPFKAVLAFVTAAVFLATGLLFCAGGALAARPLFAFVTTVVLILDVLISEVVVCELGAR